MKTGVKFLMLLSLTGLAGQLSAQAWTEEEINERLHYGLKLGLGLGSMWGGELVNARPYMGPVAGFYWYTKEKKSPYAFQTGLEGSLRGSNFANTDENSPNGGNSNYRRIGIISADVPLLLNYRLGPQKENKYSCLQVGLLVSGIVKSTVYLGNDKLPAQHYLDSSSHLYRWKNLPLKPVEVLGVIGYQSRGAVAGWQVQLKVGLNDMNDGFVMPYAYPATGTGRRISTWRLDLSVMF